MAGCPPIFPTQVDWHIANRWLKAGIATGLSADDTFLDFVFGSGHARKLAIGRAEGAKPVDRKPVHLISWYEKPVTG